MTEMFVNCWLRGLTGVQSSHGLPGSETETEESCEPSWSHVWRGWSSCRAPRLKQRVDIRTDNTWSSPAGPGQYSTPISPPTWRPGPAPPCGPWSAWLVRAGRRPVTQSINYQPDVESFTISLAGCGRLVSSSVQWSQYSQHIISAVQLGADQDFDNNHQRKSGWPTCGGFLFVSTSKTSHYSDRKSLIMTEYFNSGKLEIYKCNYYRNDLIFSLVGSWLFVSRRMRDNLEATYLRPICWCVPVCQSVRLSGLCGGNVWTEKYKNTPRKSWFMLLVARHNQQLTQLNLLQPQYLEIRETRHLILLQLRSRQTRESKPHLLVMR